MDKTTANSLLLPVPYIHLFQGTMQLSPKSILRAKLQVLEEEYDALEALSDAEWDGEKQKEWEILLLRIEAAEWLEDEMSRGN
ncbi:hypothetical protein CKM354_000214600 [Cercospora kikuchii]|uniref:Uncharacterized protein n=1 Tax=Cercospora kikuchii TaxID=84275 RepID=A0A9P3C8Q4_9PEZI|nr:uncharacterized protein CKM354_000214600 [Cercospora kikuchii]GIZ38742.1 hypothetical protein CKM354_000214600 [Cercospora kikuchii]